MEFLAIALALGAAFCWGMDQVLGKIALRDLDVPTFNAIRPLSALIFIVPYALLSGGLSFHRIDLILVAALSGIVGLFIGVEIYFYVMNRSAAHRVIPLGNTDAFWVIVIAILFLGEEAKPVVFISVALLILGTFFLASRRGTSNSNLRKWGIILALAVGVMWGSTIPIAKYCLNHGMSRSTVQTISVATAAIACSTAMLAHHPKEKLKFTNRGLKTSFLSGFFAFFLGFALWLSALSMETATLIAPFVGATMLFGFILSVPFLGERPTKGAFLGTILIFLGILLVTIWG